MRNLKITFFFVAIIGLLTGCQAESIATEQTIHDYGMSQKYISLEELKANDGAYTTLKKIIENSDISRTARSVYYEDYNFFVNTDKILFIEHGDYNSYTFPVFRLPDNGKTENLVLSLEADGTYTSALYSYTLTQQEKIALETGTPTLISDRIVRTKLRIDPHDFFQRGILVSYTEVIVIPCGSGEHGAHNFGAWGSCVAPVKAQILVITRYLTVDDGLPDFLGWTEGGEYSRGNYGGGNLPYNPNIPPFDPSRDMDLIAGHFTQPILNLPTDEQNFFNNDLNDDLRAVMNNNNIRVPLLNYLSQNEYSQNARNNALLALNYMHQTADEEFTLWTISYFENNPNTTPGQFSNWFMGEPEGPDGSFDAAYWDNPNLTFPAQTLPTLSSFTQAYPSHYDALYDTPAKIYGVVGGVPLQIFNSSGNNNTCALRVSRALNYSGIALPNIPNKTFLGADGKYYFLGAANLCAWMKKTFGVPQDDNHLTTVDGGENGNLFPSKVNSKNGIYIMIPINTGGCDGSGFCASGHADFLTNGVCDGKCYFNVNGGVKDIFIWTLN